MKKIFIFLAFSSLLVSAPSLPTRDLIILLDYGQSEELLRSGSTASPSATVDALTKLGAITSTLLPALYQKTAPILVSRSLLYSLLMRTQIFEDFLTLDVHTLASRYTRDSVTQAPTLGLFKQHCLYAKNMHDAIQRELSELGTQDKQIDMHSVVRTLTTKHPYLESSAPRSLQLYSGEKRSMKEQLHRELQVYALCYYAPLSPDQYAIKEVSDELILLIPRSREKPQNLSYIGGSPSITPVEKTLGLKVHHLKDITDIEELRKKPVLSFGIPLSQDLKKIFVTKQEGGIHVWALYLTGHGLPAYPERKTIEYLSRLRDHYAKQLEHLSPMHSQERKTLSLRHFLMQEELLKTESSLRRLPKTHEKVICSVALDEFKKVLELLQHEIHTSILLYTSCFGGGEHLTIPYQGTTQILDFDCICGSLSDTVSFQTTPMFLLPPYRRSLHATKTVIEGIHQDVIDMDQKRLIPFSSIHFDEFFRQVRDPQRDPFALIYCLHPYTDYEGKLLPDNLENISLLRSAGSRTFTIVHKGNSLLPLHNQSLGSQTDAVLLTQPSYKHLSVGTVMPHFVSAQGGPAYHSIDSLEATTHAMGTVFMNFLDLPTLSTPKVFWIKKLSCKKDTPPPFFLPLELLRSPMHGQQNKYTVLYDVIITRNIPTTESCTHEASINIYFSDAQGTTWHIPIKKKWGAASKVTKELVHAELFTLLPGLRDTCR
jgi:hypothetical protein